MCLKNTSHGINKSSVDVKRMLNLLWSIKGINPNRRSEALPFCSRGSWIFSTAKALAISLIAAFRANACEWCKYMFKQKKLKRTYYSSISVSKSLLLGASIVDVSLDIELPVYIKTTLMHPSTLILRRELRYMWSIWSHFTFLLMKIWVRDRQQDGEIFHISGFQKLKN